MSSSKHPVSVLFDDEEYARLVRKAAELTLVEGRRVSVAELVRRATVAVHMQEQDTADTLKVSSTDS